MLQFQGVSLITQPGKNKAYRLEKTKSRLLGREISKVYTTEGDKLVATVKQKPSAKTDVEFFDGKGAFSAVVSSRFQRQVFPGSKLVLTDTRLNMPGRFDPSSHPVSDHKPYEKNRSNCTQAVMPAAGEAQRLRRLAGPDTNFSKPGLPLNGQDGILVNNVKMLYQHHGIRTFIINFLNTPEAQPLSDNLKQQLEALKDSGEFPGIQLHYIDENKASGDGSILIKAIQKGYLSPDQPVLQLYGDAVMDLDVSRLANVHQDNGNDITTAVQEVSDADLDKFGISKTSNGHSGDIIALVEKPGQDPEKLKQIGNSRLGNTGIAIISNRLYDKIQEEGAEKLAQNGQFNYVNDCYRPLLEEGYKIAAEELPGYWRDAGSPPEYLDSLRDAFLNKFRLPGTKKPADGCYYDKKSGVLYWPGTKEVAQQEQKTAKGNILVTKRLDTVS
jgi:NDP-sugar pyrophosphorylase family protein